MALPKIEHPLFDLTIPSTKQKIKFRPFLVKEEKILLLAQESNNVKDMVSACKQIVTNCVIDNINVLGAGDMFAAAVINCILNTVDKSDLQNNINEAHLLTSKILADINEKN